MGESEADRAAALKERHAALKAQHAQWARRDEADAQGVELATLHPVQHWEDMDFDDEKHGGLSLKEWAQLDLGALAVMGAKKFVQQRPVLTSVWVFGLLLALLASGFPVDDATKEAYSVMRQHADSLDSVELNRALGELRQEETKYSAASGWLGSCDENCTRAYDRVQMAKAEVTRWQRRRDDALSEARHEVGIWSKFGVQDVRDSFWSAWKAGKEFASRMTFWDTMFMTVGRDEPLQQVVIRMVLKYVVNLSLGLIGAFCYFMYSLYVLIVSYGPSIASGLAFFLLALVAGASVLGLYLSTMYGAVGGCWMIVMRQAAIKQALEGSPRKGQGRSLQCPV